MHIDRFEGIAFVEGRPASCRTLGGIEVQVGGSFKADRPRGADDVRRLMAEAVRRKGGDAVVDFAHGRRAAVFAEADPGRDVVWYGSGIVARIGPDPPGPG